MTRVQFAWAVRADEKWVENAARLLGRRLAYTPDEARWLGLVRVLTRTFGIPLVQAGRLAEEALRHPPETRAVVVAPAADGSAALVVDLARYHSSFAAALSAALHHVGPRRRGRPPSPDRQQPRTPLAAAAAHGIDLSLLREGLRHTPAERLQRLDADAAFLRAIRPVSAPMARPARAPE